MREAEPKRFAGTRSGVRLPGRAIRKLRIAGALLAAWTVPALAQPQPAAGTRLVVNTAGNNSIRLSIGSKSPEPLVRVLDENARPVSGATVTFTIVTPNPNGPGAAFGGDSKTLRVTTDTRGDAVARGLRPNQVAGGPYAIQVQAQKAGMASPETPTNIRADNVLEIKRLVMTPGDPFENNICKKVPGELKVQVRDDRDNPVVGANVTFSLPADGAAGTFTGGSFKRTVATDENGQVSVKEFTPNKVEEYSIEAIASLADLRANVAVPGSNVRKECSSKTLYIVLGVAAAAGGGIAAAAAGGKGNSTSSSSSTGATPPAQTPTITIGSGGDPRFGPGH